MVKVLIADDRELIRQSLKIVLGLIRRLRLLTPSVMERMC